MFVMCLHQAVYVAEIARLGGTDLLQQRLIEITCYPCHT